MRCFLGFFLFISLGLQGQHRLPNFDSELLEEVLIDSAIKNSPSQYFIKTYEYNKDSAQLLLDDLVLHYYLEDGKLKQIEFIANRDTLKTHNYDKFGRVIGQRRFGFGEKMPRITYTYDDQQQLASETVYRIGDRVHSKKILKFNSQNKITSKEEYRGKNQLTRFWIYRYNEQGDMVSDQYFSAAQGSKNSEGISPIDSTHFAYDYDDQNRILKSLQYTENHLTTENQFSYFPDSVVQKETFYKRNGQPNEQHVRIEKDSLRIVVRGFFYDGDTTRLRSRFKEVYLYNDLIEYESRTIRGTYVDRYKTYYEYDEIGNWIKKTTYSKGIIIKKEERTIVY